jgi:tight adherence protein B
MNPVIATLFGAGIGAGIWLTLYGFTARRSPSPDTETPSGSAMAHPMRLQLKKARPYAFRLCGAILVAVVVWWWTDWPVTGAAAGLLTWWGRVLFGPDVAGRAAVAKSEAVAAWIESLAGTVAAGLGLSQALAAVTQAAPPELEAESARLARTLDGGQPLEAALHAFAREVDDEICSEAVHALIRAHKRSGDIAALLNRLATTARENAALQMDTIASRARVRTASRLITATAVALIGLTVASRPDFLAYYDGPMGQALLGLVLGLFGLSLAWLTRMGRWQQPASLIDLGETS